MNKPRPLQFVQLPTGCWICASHLTNQDGYFRYYIRGHQEKPEMFHRSIWRLRKGPIPDGFEINHTCHNRGCCNIEHLECIGGADHAKLSNEERWMAPSGRLMK